MADYSQLFEQALGAMESARYAEACERWERAAAELHGEDPETLWERAVVELNRAVCLSHLERWNESAQICTRLLSEDSGCPLAPEEDMGQQALGLLFDGYFASGDLGKARAVSEKAVQALEAQEEPSCAPAVFAATASRRAALAREMGKPDDAEEALTLALLWLKSMRTSEEAEVDEDQTVDLALLEAGLLQTRAHNRYEGQAVQLALFDLEDAVKLLSEELGDDEPETVKARELWAQLAQGT